MSKIIRYGLAAALVFTAAAAPALAQRDPAYAAARAAGKIGEKVNGYLGVVGGGSPALAALVDDLNIKRKAIYAGRAGAQNATVEEYAFAMGCRNIAETALGERYQAPDGSWQVRGDGAPLRDGRCP